MYLIGLSGGSGSGKTTFLHRLIDRLDSDKVTYISLDEYYFPRDKQLTDNKGVKNFDLPSSIDIESLLGDLLTLRSGKVVKKEEYTFNNDLKEPKVKTYRPNPIVIIEGLFIYHYENLRSQFDLKLFVDAPSSSKIIRRIKRDRIERNYPLDDVLYRYEHHVLPSYQQYIEPFIDQCDLIINNTSSMDAGLEVICGYLKTKLV